MHGSIRHLSSASVMLCSGGVRSMALQAEVETGNHLKLALEKKQFFCTAELVLGRDHNVVEAETLLRKRRPRQRGSRSSVSRISLAATRRCLQKPLSRPSR